MHKRFAAHRTNFAIGKPTRCRYRAKNALQFADVVIRLAKHAGAATETTHQQRTVHRRQSRAKLFLPQQRLQMFRRALAVAYLKLNSLTGAHHIAHRQRTGLRIVAVVA